MAASLSDQSFLAASVSFQGRVRLSLTAACIAIGNETAATAFHYDRRHLSVSILNDIELSSGVMPPFVRRFAAAAATDASVIADATQSGIVVLTGANIDAQQALVTDAHIANAISSQFNSFFYPA